MRYFLIFCILTGVYGYCAALPEDESAVQEQSEISAEEAVGEQPSQEEQPAKPPEEAAAERVKKIEEQTIPILAGPTFLYDPQGRRDPFVSPTDVPEPSAGTETVKPGIGNMRIQEILLVGVIRMPDATKRALVMGSDNMGYWLKEGDRLKDGSVLVVSVENEEVIFKQDITDPLAIKPYREVKKQLYPTEEVKRK